MKIIVGITGLVLLSFVGLSQQMTEILGRPTSNSITVNVLFDSRVEAYFEYGTNKGAYTNTTAVVTSALGEPIELKITELFPATRYFYRTRYRSLGQTTYLASDEHTFITQRKQGSTFRFTIEADPHYYDKKGCWPLWDIALANQLKDTADFMIDMGDTFGDDRDGDTKTSEEIKQLHLKCRDFFGEVCHSLPLLFCIGNHEGEFGYYLLQNPPNNIATYGTIWRKFYYPNPYPDGFYIGNNTEEGNGMGKPENYFAWEWGDALFVVVDAYRYYTSSAKPRGWDWTIGKEQYDWFKQTLENSTAKYKFVFTHHILGETRGGVEVANLYEWGDTINFEKQRPGWGLPLHQLMVKNKVDIFFQGHDHIYVKQELDNMVYQTVPMPSDSSYKIGVTDNGDAFLSGKQLGGSGHLRVTVSSDSVLVEYVNAMLPQHETNNLKNGQILDSYIIVKESVPTSSISIPQYPKIMEWSVFPNPTNGEINISFNQPITGTLKIQLVNMQGRVIQKMALDQGLGSEKTVSLKMNNAAGAKIHAGIYIVQVMDENNRSTYRKIAVH